VEDLKDLKTSVHEGVHCRGYMSLKRKTVGQLSQELDTKDDYEYSPIDLGREMLKELQELRDEAVAIGKKKLSTDFYVAIYTGAPNFYKRTITNRPFVLSACPTPMFDQKVWRYDRKKDSLVEIWSIPDKETCKIMTDSAAEVDPSEWELLRYIFDFYDGKLLIKAKKLNGEID
jgi:hypothetical protein